MAMTPDNEPIKTITKMIVKDAAEKVGWHIKKEIIKETVFVDPSPMKVMAIVGMSSLV